MDSISSRMKAAIKARGMKQIELARLANIHRGTINNYLSGRYEPKQTNIFRIAKALNVAKSYLLGFDVEMDGTSKHPEVEQTKWLQSRTPKELIVGEINELLKGCDEPQLKKIYSLIKTFVE